MTGESTSGPVPAKAGIGLRLPHHELVLEERPAAAWFEVHPENYMADDDALAQLERVRDQYPLSLHAVGLSPGSVDGPSRPHLTRLAQLVRQLRPGLVSDHLSWSHAGGRHLPDLLPLPYTEEALAVVCGNVAHIQDVLGRTILLENPSTYLEWAHSVIPEPLFIAEVARRTGCGVLLDINNIFVSARNQGRGAGAALEEWIAALRLDQVGEMHLAGHALTRTASGEELRIDDHGSQVCDEVWAMYARAVECFGAVPALIEWDTRLPPFATLLHEATHAQAILDDVCAVAGVVPRPALAHAR